MAKDPRALLLEQLFTVQRIANALADDSDAVLREAFDKLVGELARLDPTAVQLRYRRDRISRLLERVAAIIGPAYEVWLAEQRAALATVGAHQAEAATLHLRAALGAGNAGTVPSSTGLGPNYFKRILDAQPFQGATLKEWAADRKRTTVFRVSQQIKLGVANGATLDDIVRLVRGRSVGRGKYAGGVMETTTREASAIVRTAVNDINTHAQTATYQANSDILEGYQLAVTFDGRTSPTCVRYGLTPEKVYPIQGGPKPPFHMNCRTVTVPAVDWGSLGMEPPPDGTRATATGQVGAASDIEGWLRGAPPKYADDLLGATRARLFREGKVGLRDLLRTDKGRVRLTPVSELVA